MESTCFLDIETIPAQSEAAFKEALAAVKPPGNIKKPESIDAWMKENAVDAAMNEIAKTSFDPAKGHICTIAWSFDDSPVWSSHAESVDQERDVLAAFFDALKPNHRHSFVGHYIGGFDIRFILCRAVVLGVQIPRNIPRDTKPWDSRLFDTMNAWAGAKGSISMDDLAKALGVAGKDGFDGSMVAEAWSKGEHEKIEEYCRSDVEAVREIWRKFQAVGW